jgi:hypothetical protein
VKENDRIPLFNGEKQQKTAVSGPSEAERDLASG